jgi:UDP-glucose 4-epimerase
MKVLVTGGAGFIGSHLVDAHLARGDEVVIVDNLSTGRRENLNPQARFHNLDLRDPALADLIAAERPEVVSHHAAQIDVRRAVGDPMFDAEVNILGSLRLLQACAHHGVGRVLFASTGGAIYGEVTDLPASEDVVPRPLSPYGIAKLSVEHYVRFFRDTRGLRATILRYANIYGPRQDPLGEAGVVAIFLNKMLAGERPTIFGDGNQRRDFVFVGDVVRANLAALERDVPGPLNIGSGQLVSVNELFRELATLTGFRGEPVMAPARAGEVHSISLDATRAGEMLGWQPTVSLTDGLRRTLEWARRG